MYQGLLHLHNIGRWVILILLLVAIFNAVGGIAGNKPYTNGHKKVALFLMISAHIMLVIGLYQWAVGAWGLQNILNSGMSTVMKNKVTRFWAVEHITGMLIGIILITLGRGAGKKPISDLAKHKKSFWFFLWAFIIIMVTVPWPFRDVARPLFPGVAL